MLDEKIYLEIPVGWRLIGGATCPLGFKWIDNFKSWFDKEHIIAMLKIEEVVK